MKTDMESIESIDLDQLMAEADELVRQIDADALEQINEEHRLQFEIHAQKLETIKAKVQGKIEKKGALNSFPGAEGIHEAILDIVKGMGDLKKYLS